MANEIVTELRIELDKYRSDLKQAAKEGAEAGSKTVSSFGNSLEAGFSKVPLQLKAALAAAGAALAGAFTIKEAVAAATEQENAIKKLNTALMVNGSFSKQASSDLVSFADQLSRVTGVADDVIVKGEAMIATLSGLSGQALKDATKGALDLSAALGIDTDTAFNLVAKAATGNTEALGRYGIRLKSTGDAAQDFSRALDLINAKFGGFSGAMASTFSGALAKAQNGFGEILESIGNMIIKSPTAIKFVNMIGDAFFMVADKIAEFANNRDLIGEALTSLIAFGEGVVTYVIAPLELAVNATKIVGLSIAYGIQSGIDSFLQFHSAFTTYVTAPVLEFFGTTFGGLIGLFNESLGASITSFVNNYAESVKGAVNGAAEVTGAARDQIGAQLSEATGKIFDFDVATRAQSFLNKTNEFVATVKTPVDAALATVGDSKPAEKAASAWDMFFSGFKGKAQSFGETAKQLGATLNATLGTGITNSFAAMGAAFVKGEDGLAAFGRAFVGVLGDIALQTGAAAIGIGLTRLLLGDPIGGALMAGGAALGVLGGALKAWAGQGGGSPVAVTPAAAVPGGGGVAASSAGDVTQNAVSTTDLAEQSPRQRQNQVIVNVQGNILDNRETGLHLVGIINDSFNNGNAFVASTGGLA